MSGSQHLQLEKGQRPITADLAGAAAALYRLSATALPVPETAPEGAAANPDKLARQLSGLGYPGFAHLAALKANPAAVVLEALLQKDLEVRFAEALPWVLLTYPDLDWSWLVRHAKLQDAQNRLGFLVALAKNLTAGRPEFEPALKQLTTVEQRSLGGFVVTQQYGVGRETSDIDFLAAIAQSPEDDVEVLAGLGSEQSPMERPRVNKRLLASVCLIMTVSAAFAATSYGQEK